MFRRKARECACNPTDAPTDAIEPAQVTPGEPADLGGCLQWVKLEKVPSEYAACMDRLGKFGKITSAKDVYRALSGWYDKQDQEVCVILLIDVQLNVRGAAEVSRGERDSAVIPVADILRIALVDGATGILLCHNHPTGHSTPSDDDKTSTIALAQACQAVGLMLMDHVIFGAGEFFSFADTGLLESSLVVPDEDNSVEVVPGPRTAPWVEPEREEPFVDNPMTPYVVKRLKSFPRLDKIAHGAVGEYVQRYAGIHRASRAQENPRGPANDKTVCDECGCTGEHETWCSVAPEAIPASVEVMWAAVTADGREVTRFAFLEDSTDAQRRAYAEKRLNRLAAGGGMNVLDSYSVVRVRENPRRENPIDGTDRSDTFNVVVEYAVRDLFEGKSIRSAARATAKKFSGFENYLLGPGVTIIDPVALEAALWNRMAEYAVAAIPKLRVGKEHFALGGTLQFYRQAQTSDARAKLKSLVVEKLGSDPFTSDDGT